MATITTSVAERNQPEAHHVGDNVAICRVSLSLTVSSGDIHRIGKIPHGAIPLDAVFYPSTNITTLSTGPALAFGTSASASLFFAATSYSVASGSVSRTTRTLGTSKQISLSDDAMPRFEYITMTATAGGAGVGSVGYLGDLIVYYKMPGQTL